MFAGALDLLAATAVVSASVPARQRRLHVVRACEGPRPWIVGAVYVLTAAPERPSNARTSGLLADRRLFDIVSFLLLYAALG